jgi:hypothetical protein
MMRSPAFAFDLLVAALLTVLPPAASSLPAQTPPAQAAPAPPRCDTPDHRRFDFWVGDWDVTSDGQPVGTNLITLEEAGCVVHEHWTGTEGGTGQSFNFYDRADRRWHQWWVSNSGQVLDLAGTFADSTLTLRGERRRPNGSTIMHRLAFRANPDGSVRQLWETSKDGGSTWEIAFDGLYRKKGAKKD